MDGLITGAVRLVALAAMALLVIGLIPFHENVHSMVLRRLAARPIVGHTPLRAYAVAPTARLSRSGIAPSALLPLAVITPLRSISAAVLARATVHSAFPSVWLAFLFIGWFHI
jgi:hypothetical protein